MVLVILTLWTPPLVGRVVHASFISVSLENRLEGLKRTACSESNAALRVTSYSLSYDIFTLLKGHLRHRRATGSELAVVNWSL